MHNHKLSDYSSSPDSFKLELDLESDENDDIMDIFHPAVPVQHAHSLPVRRYRSVSSHEETTFDEICLSPTFSDTVYHEPTVESSGFFHILATDVDGLDTLGLGNGKEWSAHSLYRIITEHNYSQVCQSKCTPSCNSATTSDESEVTDIWPADMLSVAPWGIYQDPATGKRSWVY